MPDSRRVFEQIVKQRQAGQQPLAVFDLDNTLFEVTPRSQKILNTLLAELKSQWPAECEALQALPLKTTDWGIEPLRERGAQKLGRPLAPDFWAVLFKKWRQLFFSNDFLLDDRPYDGAVEYVQQLHTQGVQIYYLTGRNNKNMWQGTLDSLQQWKFPVQLKGANLHLKPKSHYKDDEFKARFLEQLSHPHGEVWFFENEALILQVAGQRVPDVNLVFMNTTHSGRAPEPTHLLQISSFQNV